MRSHDEDAWKEDLIDEAEGVGMTFCVGKDELACFTATVSNCILYKTPLHLMFYNFFYVIIFNRAQFTGNIHAKLMVTVLCKSTFVSLNYVTCLFLVLM